jgi:hypothetical protein
VTQHIGVVAQQNSITSPCLQKLVQDGQISQNGTVDVMFGSLRDSEVPWTQALLLESEPLGRAEYLLPISSFFAKETFAVSLFSSLSKDYQCNKDIFSSVNMSDRKKVVWTKAVGNSPVKIDPNYHERLLLAAGAHLLMDSTSSSTNASSLFSSADDVIDETVGVKNMEDFYRAYNIRVDPLRIPSIHPSLGKVYKMDRLVNAMDGWGKSFSLFYVR